MKRKRGTREEEVDADQDFLDQVLNQLYDLGDGAKGKRSKKSCEKGKNVANPGQEESEEEDDDDVSGVEKDEDFHKSDEGVDKRVFQSERQQPKLPAVEVVIFQDPRKKNTFKKTEPEAKASSILPEGKKKTKMDSDKVLSIEQARLEVHRFGITGFQKQQQRVFEQDRAIMLGAQPPKKEYVNYKLYQQMIKEKKLKEKEVKSESQKQKKKPGKLKTEKRKSAPSGGEPTGQVGRFKDGMLVLSSKDIQKLKVKVRK